MLKMYVCINYDDLLTISAILDDIAILDINDNDYHCNINGISKSETLNLF